MRNYNYNRILEILEIKFGGVLTVEDLIDNYEKIRIDNDLPKDLKIVLNLKDSNFKIQEGEIKLLFPALKALLEKHDKIAEAIIISQLVRERVAPLFDEYEEFENYRKKLFSTKDAAIKWLG